LPTRSGVAKIASTAARSASAIRLEDGRYEVPVELFTDVTVDVTTLIVPEGGELPPEEASRRPPRRLRRTRRRLAEA
jgi:hypothetical protein